MFPHFSCYKLLFSESGNMCYLAPLGADGTNGFGLIFLAPGRALGVFGG